MAIGIITGFNSGSRETLDKRSGPYESVGLAFRYIRKTRWTRGTARDHAPSEA